MSGQTLTRRQKDVLEALRCGYDFNPDEDDAWVIATVAGSLGMGVPAVRYHLRQLKAGQDRKLLELYGAAGEIDIEHADTVKARRATITDDEAAKGGFTVPKKKVGTGARRAGKLVRDAEQTHVAVDDLEQLAAERGVSYGVVLAYLRTYTGKERKDQTTIGCRHVDADGIERYGEAGTTIEPCEKREPPPPPRGGWKLEQFPLHPGNNGGPGIRTV